MSVLDVETTNIYVIFYYVDYKTNTIIAKAQRRKPDNNSTIFDLVDVLVHNTPKNHVRNVCPAKVHK